METPSECKVRANSTNRPLYDTPHDEQGLKPGKRKRRTEEGRMIPRYHEDDEIAGAGALPKGSKTVSLSHTDNATVLPQRTDAWSDVRRSASRQYIEIAKSAESDSGKTSILTALLCQEENHSLLECFRGEGQWHGHGPEAHFEGAPNWRVVIAKLDTLPVEPQQTSSVVTESDVLEKDSSFAIRTLQLGAPSK